MKKAICLLICLLSGTANAALIGFVSNPTGNSTDWASQVSLLGGTVNSNVNFDTMATGTLNSNFYTVSDGVTLISSSNDVSTVQFGAGPGQNNVSSAPVSIGEGLHASSNYLFDGGVASSLTISFASNVLAVGLDIIDYFNPYGSNPLTIEAFTGQNGTGASLGLFSSVAFNFQRNNTYFMGLVSTQSNIGSLVFTDVNAATGDTTGIDNIVFATSSNTPVPAPAPIALLGLGLAVLSFTRKLKKSQVAL